MSTHTIATGTCACPPARCEPSGRASCAPRAAPPKKPTSEKKPTTAPLRKPPIAYAIAAPTMIQSTTVINQLGRTTSVPVIPWATWIVQTNLYVPGDGVVNVDDID